MPANPINKVRGIPVLPALPDWLAYIQGNIYHVKPYSGSDSNDGLTINNPLKTLSRAQTLATADQNDVVLFYSESNTASLTTDYQSSTLTWAKDGVHLIGVGSGVSTSSRARVAFVSTYDTASNLFTLSADNCYIANIQFFAGVSGTNPTGCMSVTGTRNLVKNCHIAGIGNAANDIAGAYSLDLGTGCAENTFKECDIGLGTIDAGTNANYEIYITSGDDCKFIDCVIHRRIEHISNHPLVASASATCITAGRYLLFKNCLFFNASTNYGYAQAGQFKLHALTSGDVVVMHCMATSGSNTAANTKWDASDRDRISVIGAATPAADTPNLDRRV